MASRTTVHFLCLFEERKEKDTSACEAEFFLGTHLCKPGIIYQVPGMYSLINRIEIRSERVRKQLTMTHSTEGCAGLGSSLPKTALRYWSTKTWEGVPVSPHTCAVAGRVADDGV